MARATAVKAPDRKHQLPSDPEKLIKLIEGLEPKWHVRPMATGWRVTHPTNGASVTVPRSLAGHRAGNTHSQLRNAGLDEAITAHEEARHKEKTDRIAADRDRAAAAIEFRAAAAAEAAVEERKPRHGPKEHVNPDHQTYTVPEYEVTPELAAEWLDREPATLADGTKLKQRNVNDAHVAWLTDIIQRGQWKTTHQGIALAPTHDNTGMVLDGQHRLWAIVSSGQTVKIMVTFNADPEMFTAYDVNRVRTAGDVLGMEGETDANRLASTIRLLSAYLTWQSNPEQWKSWKNWSKMKPTNQDHVDLLTKFPQLREHMAAARPLGSKPLSANIAAIAVFRQILEDTTPDGTEPLFAAGAVSDNPATATGVGDRFFYMLRTGLGFNDEEGHPVHTLRSWILARSYQRYGTARQVQLLVMIKAWNAWIERRKMHLIKIVDGEVMPKPKVPAGLTLESISRTAAK